MNRKLSTHLTTFNLNDPIASMERRRMTFSLFPFKNSMSILENLESTQACKNQL